MQQCPRCGAILPETVYLEALATAPGRLPAYRLRHKLDSGKICVAYVGPLVPAVSVPSPYPHIPIREGPRRPPGVEYG